MLEVQLQRSERDLIHTELALIDTVESRGRYRENNCIDIFLNKDTVGWKS